MDARERYTSQLSERQQEIDALRARERSLSVARLVVVGIAIAVAFWNVLVALVPLAGFVVLAIWHERIVRRRKRAENRSAFYKRGMARLEGTWAGGGDAGEELADDHHPYANDFDLFGRGSLFELISLAVTRSGRARLAAWLKSPAQSAEEIRSRQEAVRELRENVALREDIAVQAAEVAREVEGAKLEAWAAMPELTLTKWERIAAVVLPAIAILTLMLWLTTDVPLWAFIIAALAVGVFGRRLSPRVEPVILAVERAEPALALLAGVIARIERESFACERLRGLHGRLQGAASQEIERLRRLVALLDARRNQFFAPIAALLLWTVHVAVAIERWRVRAGAHAADWIDAVGEIEALSSLASFSFEHPEYAVPEIAVGEPRFEATALGHPLIPGDRRITNDLSLGGTLRLLVVSGSNMSGKSTMLRSVGIAAVLAMAGGPVCARTLRVTPMAVGASISIHDSLQENASRFYAEILRIRQVLAMAAEGPVLFLLDEVLAGTNSHDRRIGAEAIVRGLVERGAVGLVSTHDLALAQIAEELGERAANVHFEDHLEDGRVVFDYWMRPGVVTKSNALALMRSVGIEV